MYEDILAFLPPEGDYPLGLELTGISYCDGSYRIERRRSPIFVFEYVVKGTGTLIIDGKTYHPSAGDVYIIPDGSDHLYYADPQDPWEKIFFNIRGQLIRQLLTAYGLNERPVIHAREAEPLFRDFFESAKQGGYEEIIHRSALKLHEIIMLLHEVEHRRYRTAVSPEAARLKALIDSKLQSSLSTAELAAAIYRSKDYVIKLFQKEFGETPHAYYIRQKMALAQNLLSGTQLSVKQIAAALNYQDQHYFSNVFRRVHGMSPTDYRKQIQKKQG